MKCPCCEQELPAIPEERLNALRNALKGGRSIYECRDGSFAITYGGGPVDIATIQAALAAGMLENEYPDPNVKCWRLKS